MCKYSMHDIDEFFGRHNLGFYSLSKILDIPHYRIRKYLIGDGSATTEDALKIDTAIRVIEELDIRKPEWNIGEVRQGKVRSDIIDVWNNEMKHLIQKKEQERIDNACNIIVFILNDKTGRDEFREVQDPLVNGGLSRYGTDEFIRHLSKAIAYMD